MGLEYFFFKIVNILFRKILEVDLFSIDAGFFTGVSF